MDAVLRGGDASAPRPTNLRLLDVAMGRGRHALPLARAGVRVFGVDKKWEAVADAMARARLEDLPLRAWCADLTEHPLPAARFDVVLVTRYLQRDLFPALRRAIVPGGVAVYETFTIRQLDLGVGPTSPDHLLKTGELPQLFETFDILFSEEVDSPEAVARVIARRPFKD